MWEGLGFESPGAGGEVVGGLGRWSFGPVFTPKPEPLGAERGVRGREGGGVEVLLALDCTVAADLLLNPPLSPFPASRHPSPNVLPQPSSPSRLPYFISHLQNPTSTLIDSINQLMPFDGHYYPSYFTIPCVHTTIAWVAPVGIKPLTSAVLIGEQIGNANQP